MRDRGHIKWTAMMLPEHVSLLKQYIKSQNLISKPEMDEQSIEKANAIISEAMEFTLKLSIVYYEGGKFKKAFGYIDKFDEINRIFWINGEGNTILKLKVEDIIEVNFL